MQLMGELLYQPRSVDLQGICINNDLIKKRYSGSKDCRAPLKEKPLGFEKLSSLFVLIMIGSILSILVLLLEYVNQRKKKKQEITAKVVQKIHEYIDGFGLSKMEIENILKNLYQNLRAMYWHINS